MVCRHDVPPDLLHLWRRQARAALPRDMTVAPKGADRWAAEIGKSLGLQTMVFDADWERLGRKAGGIRNGQVVANIDEAAAFLDGRSRGRLTTVVLAVNAGVPGRSRLPRLGP